MNNKILFKCLPIFLSLVLVFGCSINVFAADSGGPAQPWNGDLLFHDQDFTIPLLQTFANNELTNSDGDTVFRYKSASFDGSVSNLLRITGTPGTYLNGTAHTTYTFTTAEYEDGIISVALASNVYDGMTVTSQNASYVGNQTVINVHVNFSNFEITSSQMYFPILFNVSYSNRYDETFDIVPSAVLIRCVGNDWTDDVAMYTSMEDLPGSKGVIGSIIGHISTWFNNLMDRDLVNHKDMKNHISSETANITDTLNSNTQTMTNQSQSNSNAQIQANNTNSANEIANANANSQAEINQSKENTDNLMNGFNDDNADLIGTNMKFDVNELDNSESMMLMLGTSTMKQFTFPDNIDDSIYNGMGLCGTLMQAIFESSGQFGWVVTSSFAFIIIRMIAGFSKFQG